VPVSRPPQPLFNPRLLARRVASFGFPSDLPERQAVVRRWIEMQRAGVLDRMTEVSLHGDFLGDIFRKVLGYCSAADTGGQCWELYAEKHMSAGGGQADAALGFFTAEPPGKIYAPIELKGGHADLDREMARGYTPVDQGWRYLIETPGCRWVLVSNYRETRLYHLDHSQQAYERFLLEEMADEAVFRRFFYLLCRANFLPAKPDGVSVVAELLDDSARAQVEVTDKLYRQYKQLRSQIFAHVTRARPDRDPSLLLEKTQKILDRVLFIAFAEDRGLLPANTIRDAFDHTDPYHSRPRWENFKAVFAWIDRGNGDMQIPAYNGGLFRPDPVLEDLDLPDDLVRGFRALADYDYAEDVSVLVLGHIFEQSISDLEEMRAQAAEAPATAPRAVSKRKREGVFYTPSFVTRYIVERALGTTLAEKKAAAFQKFAPDRQRGEGKRTVALIGAWEAYRDALTGTRILDPACGSGAFLLSAFDYLLHEYELVNAELAALRGGQASLFDLTKTILNNNLYGVDLNPESVEITRLSLWLKTAERGKALTDLDHNIRCGNSVVADPAYDTRAFDWKAAFPEVFADGGFDVALGNPPYVQSGLISALKPHLKTRYSSFNGSADLYVYFYEIGLRLLRAGGRLSYIVTNKWLRAGYGEELRGFFSASDVFEEILDFGHAPIFEEADVFPCIVVVRKPAATPNLNDMGQPGDRPQPAPDSAVKICPVPGEKLPGLNLTQFVSRECYSAPWRRFTNAPWSLEPPAVDALMEKIRRAGVPLKEFIGAAPIYGIKTGLNDAFLIDTPTRDRLVREDPKCAEIIKPYLRGQDIERWTPEWAGLWLILIKSSGDASWPWGLSDAPESTFASTYPSVYRWLKPMEAALRKRLDKGRHWWELRSCANYEGFERPKVIYQEIQFHPCYALDADGYYANNKVFSYPRATRTCSRF
jgi:hypothetical protein